MVLKMIFEVASWYSQGQPASTNCSFNPARIFNLVCFRVEHAPFVFQSCHDPFCIWQ